MLLDLLGPSDYLITHEHYGNDYHGPLKKIYVVGHIYDHTEFNKLGYGIVVVSVDRLNELRDEK